MSAEVERFVVDRFERGIAVLVSDDGGTIEVDRTVLPARAEPGHVLRVARHGEGEIRWRDAVVDEEATAERLSEAEEIIEELRGRDPGGDVVL